MRTVVFLLLAILAASAPASAVDPDCVSVDDDVACEDVAVSVFGSASGGFLAVSGTGDATTYMDRCLESICPSVAVAAAGTRRDAYAECHASSICVAVAGFGHARHEGIGFSFGFCDTFYAICYPVRATLP